MVSQVGLSLHPVTVTAARPVTAGDALVDIDGRSRRAPRVRTTALTDAPSAARLE